MRIGLGLGISRVYPLGVRDRAGLVSGAVLDLDAALGFSGSAWVDQTGTQPNAVQSTSSKRPTSNVADSDFNGRASLSFASSSSQNMVTSAWSSGYTSFTIYCVVKVGSGLQWILDSTTSSETAILFDINGHNEFDISDGSAIGGKSSASTSPGVVAAVFAGSGSKFYDSANTAVFSGTMAPRTLQGMTIGSSYVPSSFLNGKIARILAYPFAHSSSDVAKNLAALGALYGIAIGA